MACKVNVLDAFKVISLLLCLNFEIITNPWTIIIIMCVIKIHHRYHIIWMFQVHRLFFQKMEMNANIVA